MPRRATPTGASVAARATCELVRAYKDAKLASLFSQHRTPACPRETCGGRLGGRARVRVWVPGRGRACHRI
jgi:hypothetical protein